MKKTFFLMLCASAMALIGCNKKSDPQPSGITPLDYTKDANWMLKAANPQHEVDLFYIYPTSADANCPTLVSPVDDYMKSHAYYSYQQNAECFSGYTNVFAPYYRQISMVGISQCYTPNDLIALDRNNEPWADLNAALDYYFANLNNGRPVLFASHSQGSANMHIVIDTYLKNKPDIRKRIVAFYALGYQVTQAWCDSVGVPFATGADDTGVIITWNTEKPNCTAHNLPVEGGSLVINPLTWTRTEAYAGIENNLGSLQANEAGELVKVAGRADAQINLARGVIVCTTDTNYLPANPCFGDGSFHFEDGALYYENMKANGRQRIAAYLGHDPK